MAYSFKVIDVRIQPNFSNYTGKAVYNPYVIQLLLDTRIVEFMSDSYGYALSFRTIKEAETFAVANMPSFENKVFTVLKNSDFTEGRGPMLFDKTFKKFEDAENYILSQNGISGSSQYKQISYGINIYGAAYARIEYNGYNIKMSRLE